MSTAPERERSVEEELAAGFGLQKGERLWLSSEILRFVMLCRREGRTFDPDRLIDCFQEAVGEEGTILIPTFCFNFRNEGRYDYLHTKGTTGALGDIALARADFERTLHPLHSFAVWGRDRALLCAMKNRHSYGEDSPFAYCRKNNVKQIMLGTDYKHAMTLVHYTEAFCKVPYRFSESYSGIYIDRDGRATECSCDYMARRTDVVMTERFNRIGEILEEKGISRVIEYRGIKSRAVMLGESFEVIRDDILHNQCRNIYDFDVPRETLFAGFGGADA